MRLFLAKMALSAGVLCSATTALAEDSVSCAVEKDFMFCDIAIDKFISMSSRVLTNGWENQFDIKLELVTEKDTVLKTSRLHAAQRCYIDPIQTQCLVLWRGSKTWKTYQTPHSFLQNISYIRVQSFNITDLVPGDYHVRATVSVTYGSEREAEKAKSWLRQGGGNFPGISDFSFLGSFISVNAPDILSSIAYAVELETPSFYIDTEHIAETTLVDNNNND